MKIRRIITTLLAFCLLLAAVPATPVHGISMLEQTWLSWLAPGFDDPPKNETYPAQLIVYGPQFNFGFNGKCTLKGEITDEEKINVLKQACSAVDKYNTPEDACDDQRLADALTLKLSIKPEDTQRVIDNWVSILGMDKVVAIFGGKLPSYGAGDAISVGAEMLGNIAEIVLTPSGGTPDIGFGSLSPVPLGFADMAQGIMINGMLVTWDEFWRDQQKWKDRVELLNTQARLRTYYDKVRRLMNELEKKNIKWKIEIEDQIVQSILYRQQPEIHVPCIAYADVDLTKEGGGANTYPMGNYSGRIKFKTDLDLSDYDANFHRYLANALNNGTMKAMQGIGAGQAQTVPFEAVSQTVQTMSENRYTIEGNNIPVTLVLPGNEPNGIIDEQIEVMLLDQTEYVQKKDMLSYLKQETKDVLVTLYWAEMEDMEAGVYYNNTYGETVSKPTGQVIPYDNPESGSLPKPDIRQYIQMRLILDLSQMK